MCHTVLQTGLGKCMNALTSTKPSKRSNRGEAQANARQIVWFYAAIVIISQLVFFAALATMSDWPTRVSHALKRAAPISEDNSDSRIPNSPQRLRAHIKTKRQQTEEEMLELQCGLAAGGQFHVDARFQGNELQLNDLVRGSVGAGRYQLYHICLTNRPKDSHETAQVKLTLQPTSGNADLLLSFDDPRPSLVSFHASSRHTGQAVDSLLLDSNVPDWPLTDMVHLYIGVVGADSGATYTLQASTSIQKRG